MRISSTAKKIKFIGIAAIAGIGVVQQKDFHRIFTTTATCEDSTALIPTDKLEYQRTDSTALIPTDKLANPRTGKPLCVLVACGSFSPVTVLHLRIMEEARNHLMYKTGKFDVVGGYLSPVNQGYAIHKPSIVPAAHRVAMLKLATADSDWLSTSTWEVAQSSWTKTADVLKHFDTVLNSGLYPEPVHVNLVCGADLLQSMAVGGLWHPDYVDSVLGRGVAVIERAGEQSVDELVDKYPRLRKHKETIHVVPISAKNEVSSTGVREIIRGGLSIKYLTPDPVISYIYKMQLFGHQADRFGPYSSKNV
jgi:nicotinamide mononucleotide adenylyltransferase